MKRLLLPTDNMSACVCLQLQNYVFYLQNKNKTSYFLIV